MLVTKVQVDLNFGDHKCKLEGWNWLSSNHLSLPTPNCHMTKGNFWSEQGHSRKSHTLVIFLRFITNEMVGIGCHQIMRACQISKMPYNQRKFLIWKSHSRKIHTLVIFLRFITNGMVGIGCHQIMRACQHQMPPFASLAMSWYSLWSSSSQLLPTSPLYSFNHSKSYF